MQVTIEQARELLHEGREVPNSRYGRGPQEPRRIWAAKYIIHFRPKGNNHALAEEN